MYRILTLLSVFYTAETASLQSYESTTYRNYPSISTVDNRFQNPYNTAGYGDPNYPGPTSYPSFSPGYDNSNTYSTQRGYNYGTSSGYNNYGTSSGYGQGYGSSYGSGYISSYEQPFMGEYGNYCVNRTPQEKIWVDGLMGMWYGVELIQHLAGDSRVDYARSCIVIHISEPKDRPSTEHQLYHVQHINAKFRQEYRHLRLLWDEAGASAEYSLYFRNSSAGYWQVFGGQNGSMARQLDYKQFTGTIQVLKAVNDHLVLNFCQEEANGRPAQQYSVLFSREPGVIPRWEITSVHALLQNRKLSVASRRMVCGNSAAHPVISLVLSVLLLTTSYVVAS